MAGQPVNIGFALPYRRVGRERETNLAAVLDWIAQNYPGAGISTVDSDHPRFNLAGARNAGIRHFHDCDAVVICDADVLLDPEATSDALAACLDDGLIHLPYTRIQYLDPHSTSRYLDGDDTNLALVLDSTWSTGGAYVTTPGAWQNLKGQDERFTGWGYEDVALTIVHRTLHGQPMPRHEGTALHLWHPAQAKQGDPDHDQGVTLYGLYVAADGNPEAVRELIGA